MVKMTIENNFKNSIREILENRFKKERTLEHLQKRLTGINYICKMIYKDYFRQIIVVRVKDTSIHISILIKIRINQV